MTHDNKDKNKTIVLYFRDKNHRFFFSEAKIKFHSFYRDQKIILSFNKIVFLVKGVTRRPNKSGFILKIKT